MRTLSVLTLSAVLAFAPYARGEEPAADPSVDEGFSLVEEGARMILRGIISNMEPTLDDMRRDLGTALAEWEPRLRELSALVGDLSAYAPPEVLPNGDIIIRKKRAPMGPELPKGEIEL